MRQNTGQLSTHNNKKKRSFMCIDKALIQNNARIAADIAVALADRRRLTSQTPPETAASTPNATTTTTTSAADAPAVNKVPVSY